MKFYSKLQINILSLIISVIIYVFVMIYIPKLISVSKSYIYYKSQPNLVKEYED